MWYTDEEILYDVSHAQNPYQQIRILAELNDVSVKKIESVLKRHDFRLPEYQRQTYYCANREGKEVTEDHKKRREQKHAYYLRNRERILARKKVCNQCGRGRDRGEE